jgi:hypothetical protein
MTSCWRMIDVRTDHESFLVLNQRKYRVGCKPSSLSNQFINGYRLIRREIFDLDVLQSLKRTVSSTSCLFRCDLIYRVGGWPKRRLYSRVN